MGESRVCCPSLSPRARWALSSGTQDWPLVCNAGRVSHVKAAAGGLLEDECSVSACRCRKPVLAPVGILFESMGVICLVNWFRVSRAGLDRMGCGFDVLGGGRTETRVHVESCLDRRHFPPEVSVNSQFQQCSFYLCHGLYEGVAPYTGEISHVMECQLHHVKMTCSTLPFLANLVCAKPLTAHDKHVKASLSRHVGLTQPRAEISLVRSLTFARKSFRFCDQSQSAFVCWVCPFCFFFCSSSFLWMCIRWQIHPRS